jgi:hypothetical protein
LADVEDRITFQDRATPEMPHLHVTAVDVKERTSVAPSCGCGARASHVDGGEIDGQVGQPVGDQKLRIERDQVRNLWRPNGAVLSIPGR